MEYLLFVAYLILFAWLVTRLKFFTASGLSDPQLIIIFLLKVMAGIFYGWIGLYYGTLAQMSDTWSFHTNGVIEFKLLQENPGEYFTNIFNNPYKQSFEKFFNADESYWNDLKGNVFIKVLSLFNILSFGYYYVNVIFYAFLSLFGAIAIYRVMTDVFPGRKMPVMLATFLAPSFLYWTSGIHKEGMIFLGISLVVYHMHFGLKENHWGLRRFLGILLGLVLLFLLRNFILVLIIPAMLAWWTANRYKSKALAIFTGLYVLFIVLFFTIRYIIPSFDFPQAVVNKQKEFVQLKGNTSIPIEELEPTAISFLKTIPQAFTFSVVRPYPADVRHILSLAAAAELNLLFLLFLAFLFFRKPAAGSPVFIYFCLFFSFTLLLAIGFSVNNLGAIVRYRSIIIPLLVVPMVAQIDWLRLGTLVTKRISRKNNLQA